MSQRHLSEDRLIEICLAGSITTADQHLASCRECEVRRLALIQMLDDIRTVAVAEADAAFPADRLARQQARILQRIEHEGRPGRVIAFRAGQPPEAAVRRTRPASVWVGGAAVAGLVVGLLAGHFARDLPGAAIAPASQIVANEAGAPVALRAVPTTLSDDEFLGQIELAVDSGGPAALRPLDAVTPRAW